MSTTLETGANDGATTLESEAVQKTQSDSVTGVAVASEGLPKRPRDADNVGMGTLPESKETKRRRTDNPEPNVKPGSVRNSAKGARSDKGNSGENKVESKDSQSGRTSVFSPVVTRSRRSEKAKEAAAATNHSAAKPLTAASQKVAAVGENGTKTQGRWRGEAFKLLVYFCRFSCRLNCCLKFTKWRKTMSALWEG